MRAVRQESGGDLRRSWSMGIGCVPGCLSVLSGSSPASGLIQSPRWRSTDRSFRRPSAHAWRRGASRAVLLDCGRARVLRGVHLTAERVPVLRANAHRDDSGGIRVAQSTRTTRRRSAQRLPRFCRCWKRSSRRPTRSRSPTSTRCDPWNTDEAIVDALHVNLIFNIMNRLANAFDFSWDSDQHVRVGAQVIHRISYRLPRILAR